MTKRLATAQLAARAFIKKRAAVAAEGRELQSPLVNTPVLALKNCFALASLGPDDVLVDFGSGTGAALLTACKSTGCRAIGIEIEHAKVKQSRDDIDACGLSDRVTVIEADFFSDDGRHLATRRFRRTASAARPSSAWRSWRWAPPPA